MKFHSFSMPDTRRIRITQPVTHISRDNMIGTLWDIEFIDWHRAASIRRHMRKLCRRIVRVC